MLKISIFDTASQRAPILFGFGSSTTARQTLKGTDLSGKGVVVTGGNSGMGLETTCAPADAGAEVLVPRSEATRQSLAVSVLDLIAMRAGEPAGSAIARSVELARHVEQLDTNATGWQNITPFRAWLAQPHRY